MRAVFVTACLAMIGQAQATTEITDPAGDAGGGADMVGVSGGYDADNLYLAIEFAPGAFDPGADGFLIGLDADSDPETGLPDSFFFPVGGEFSVFYNAEFSTSEARVYDAVANMVIASVPVSFGTDTAEVVVALSTLASDDGVMGFGAISGSPLSAEFLSPEDFAPESVNGGPLLDQTSPVEPPCPADLAEPFGQLDFSDVVAFLGVFGAGCP